VGFFACYDRLWELINLRNDKQHYLERFALLPIPTFNEHVVREAILNAASHRNYQLSGSVFIRQYGDRLVIDSPGGFPRDITTENILNFQAPRNRRIAETFFRCGLVERSGQGMNLMYEYAVREAKSLPDFKGTDAFHVRLTLNGRMLNEKLVTSIKKIGEERLEQFATDDYLIIYKLFFGEKLLPEDEDRIEHLVDLGVLEQTEDKKVILAHGIFEGAGQAGVQVSDQETIQDTSRLPAKTAVLDGGTIQDTTQVTIQDKRVAVLLDYCSIPRTRDEMQLCIGIANRSHFRKSILKPMLDSGLLRMTIPDKPNSRNQKYVRA
jgi:ATP-dependent DNA helicase RecG